MGDGGYRFPLVCDFCPAWFRIIGGNRVDTRVDKESLYGQRDNPRDVNRSRDRWSRNTGRIARQTDRGKVDQ